MNRRPRLVAWFGRTIGGPSLQTRIVFAFAIVLLVLQTIAVLIVSISGTNTTRANLSRELVTGERVFHRTLDQRAGRLLISARVLSSDFAFREAIATKDRDTMVSALANHGARIRADVMLLMDLDRRVAASTLPDGQAVDASPVAPLIDEAEANGSASAMIVLDGRVYQLVVVPVLAPVAIGWVAMGFRLDDRDARELSTTTGLEVSFLARQAGTGWSVAGTTLPDDVRPLLVAQVARGAVVPASEPVSVTLAREDFVTLVSTESSAGDARVLAVLQRPIAEAMEPFYRLKRQLLLISAVALVLGIASSVAIARGVARPVRRLASAARRMAGGDYDEPLDLDRHDEIGELAAAFDHMRDRIMDRERRICDLAYRDSLTGLPNRALFSDRVVQAIANAARSGQPTAVVTMDLDRFKTVNDSLGHERGDRLLVEVGRRIQEVIRRRSDTIARMGGDEFAVLLSTKHADDTVHIVRDVQRAFEAPFDIDGNLVDVHVSIGVASYPEHGADLVALLRHADAAMHRAKRNGSGFAVYDPRHDPEARDTLSLMSELRTAVETNQLALHYQPKIDLARPAVLRVEALVRWNHATRGFVPPSEFIPFAEMTGYISTITEWVLDHALAQLRRWHDEGVSIHVSVNISTRDVMNSHFPALLATLLERHRCEADWLVLEITETAIVDDPVQAQSTIDRLHAQGCLISIDDFGTGYSSLAYLRRLRVDELKIDKSFVIGMASDPNAAVIIRSTIDLGHNMGLTVVAEGVETEAVLTQLRAMGCDQAQGYLMSRPLSAIDLARWIADAKWITPRPSALAA